MMISLNPILKISLLSFLFSCDPGSTIKYEIENKTLEPITAKYQFVVNVSGDTSFQEMTIPANSSKIINEDPTLGYVTHYDERHDSIFLYWLAIWQGSTTSHHNFKDKKYWILKKKDEQNATYKLIIDTALLTK